jgi:hypothetical protein
MHPTQLDVRAGITPRHLCVYTIVMLNASAETSIERAPAYRRWIALLILSALLHVVAVGLLGGVAVLPPILERDLPVITAQLRTMPPAEPVIAAAEKPPQPKILRKPKPRSQSLPRPAPVTVPEPAIVVAAETISPPPEIQEHAPPVIEPVVVESMPVDDSVNDISAKAAVATELEPVKAAASARYKISLPPSAELKYDVQALRDGRMTYGSGKIKWQSDGDSYTVDGEASILIFTLLTFKSAGVIDDFGIAPVIYAEKRFRKSETNTHFHRERNTISFSASTASYPRKGGEQDRASIIWQLTGIGRGESERFVPGAEIDLFVAGVRDGETWRIRVMGQEEIELGTGKISAWHVVRIPRAGSRDQKLDIWLAPQQEWYPVKLRYTDTNGEYLDLSLSNLNTVGGN